MNRLLHSTLGTLLLVTLVALGCFQVWQLNRIEALLGGRTAVVGPAPVATATATGDCTQSAWWKSDVAAAAEPGNLLKLHPRCRIDDPKVVRGGTFRRIWGQDPNGLNPYGDGGQSADVRELMWYVSGWLAYPDKEHPENLHPDLAQSITTPDQGLSYVIRLRKGVLWHPATFDRSDPKFAWLDKPHELTADDYVFVFENILDPNLKMRFAVLRTDLEALVAVEKVDTYTFRLTFNKRKHAHLGSFTNLEPAPSWLYRYDESGRELDRATFGETFPKHWYNQRAIGVGMYRFVDWKQGESITLERNPDYWGETAAFDKVRLQMIKDKAAWPRALQNQELDMVHLLPAQYRTTVLDAKDGQIFGDPRVKVGMNPFYGYFYIGWNRNNPRLADKRVRQALSMAVDRASILKNVYYDLGTTISGALTPDHPCYDRSVEPWPFDPTAAASLLESAGWVDSDGNGVREKVVDGERLELRLGLLVYGGSEEWATIGNQFKESYRRIGIELDLVPLEWPIMQQRTKERQFDGYTGSWSMNYEYDPRALWHSKSADEPGSQNYISFRDPEMDKLIEEYEVDFDEAHRLTTCHEMHRRLHEDEPYTFLFSRTTPVLWWSWLNDPEMFPVTPNRDLRYLSFADARP